MSRWWTEAIDAVSQVVSLPLLTLLLFLAAGVIGALWYFYPRWIPRRWPRLRRPRWPRWRWQGWRRRGRERTAVTEPQPAAAESAAEELPDLPVEQFVSLADRLAAEGRYAEAIRERLRAIVRSLVDRAVIEHRPGWTVTELANAAAVARPAVDAPLTEANRIFSDVWYGQRTATADHDARMRALTERVGAALDDRVGVSS